MVGVLKWLTGILCTYLTEFVLGREERETRGGRMLAPLHVDSMGIPMQRNPVPLLVLWEPWYFQEEDPEKLEATNPLQTSQGPLLIRSPEAPAEREIKESPKRHVSKSLYLAQITRFLLLQSW
jgi:hypothetical protein